MLAACLGLAAAGSGCGAAPTERNVSTPERDRQVEDLCRRAADGESSAMRADALRDLKKLDGELAGRVNTVLTSEDTELRSEAVLALANMKARARGTVIIYLSVLDKSVDVDFEHRLGRRPEAQQQLDMLINMLAAVYRLTPDHPRLPDLLPKYCRFGLEFPERGGYFAHYLRTNAMTLTERAAAGNAALRKACLPALVEVALNDRPYTYIVLGKPEPDRLDGRLEAVRVLGGFGSDAAKVLPLVETLRQHPDAEMRKAAADAAKRIRGES